MKNKFNGEFDAEILKFVCKYARLKMLSWQKALLENNISVKILDNNYDICQNFSETFPQIDVINGDGTNQNILIEEGIRNIGSLVTLTGMDEINIIISTFAKSSVLQI